MIVATPIMAMVLLLAYQGRMEWHIILGAWLGVIAIIIAAAALLRAGSVVREETKEVLRTYPITLNRILDFGYTSLYSVGRSVMCDAASRNGVDEEWRIPDALARRSGGGARP